MLTNYWKFAATVLFVFFRICDRFVNMHSILILFYSTGIGRNNRRLGLPHSGDALFLCCNKCVTLNGYIYINIIVILL